MKMTQKHYAMLGEAINSVEFNDKSLLEISNEYKKAKLSSTRFRWDIFWRANDQKKISRVFMQELYKYLNDDHINTALKRLITY